VVVVVIVVVVVVVVSLRLGKHCRRVASSRCIPVMQF
jgi:hypothetical protein